MIQSAVGDLAMHLSLQHIGCNRLYDGPQLRSRQLRPSLVCRVVKEDSPLSPGDQERFDRIAEALVAKLQELPDVDLAADSSLLEGGEQPAALHHMQTSI